MAGVAAVGRPPGCFRSPLERAATARARAPVLPGGLGGAEGWAVGLGQGWPGGRRAGRATAVARRRRRAAPPSAAGGWPGRVGGGRRRRLVAAEGGCGGCCADWARPRGCAGRPRHGLGRAGPVGRAGPPRTFVQISVYKVAGTLYKVVPYIYYMICIISVYKPGRSYYILLMFSQCVVLWSASGDDLLGFLAAPNLVQLYKILVHEPSL